ncbi:MAG: recombination mediator RecR [Candidatus Portnoybacteria bacterium]|nr:recombination mediator RecR [Candidatus Portnoybacteria bacterium]MDD4983058.1 recombination mediator RecR [Candidatus Portnoybacteria bacterium]
MLPPSLKTLIDHLSRLPGLGQRSATRLAFYLIGQPPADLHGLAQAIKDLPAKIKHCPRCFNLTSNSELCAICTDKKRQQNIICVVEDILDIIPIERTRQFNGVYHVLGGLISPIDGLTPDKLRIKELIVRIKQFLAQKVQPEIILALNPTTEGDTTALYLEKLLKPSNAKITKLNRGLSTGSDLEYADETTLINALKYRH